MDFTCQEAINTANFAVTAKLRRNLTDVEIIILKGAWQRLDYDTIAAQSQYATSYLSQDAAPKLWKLLTEALEEKVKKSNFKEALKRYWLQYVLPDENLDKNTSILRSSILSSQSLTPLLHQFYVERPPIESICCGSLIQPGALVRVKAPRFMGKTLFLNWILNQLKQRGFQTAYISLKIADQTTHFHDLDRFLRWICLNISRDLGLPNRLDDHWDVVGMGSKMSCTTYLGSYILPQIKTPLVVSIDDIDLLFAYPEICQDFLGLLRFWYEQARIHPLWQKLRLAIAHATDAYVKLDIYQSPFNVGLPLELPEFSTEQIVSLAQHSGFDLDTPEFTTPDLTALQAMVGGHPHLLHHAFACMSCYPGMTWTRLLEDAPTDTGIYGHHLREYWMYLQQHPDLATALGRVVSTSGPINLEPIVKYQLYRLGLVKLSGHLTESRCKLYSLYFRGRLGHTE